MGIDFNDPPDDPPTNGEFPRRVAFERAVADSLAPFRNSLDSLLRHLNEAMRIDVPKSLLAQFDVPVIPMADLAAITGLADVAGKVFQPLEAYDTLLAPLRHQLKTLNWAALMPKIDTSVFDDIARLVEDHLPPNWEGLDWHRATEFVADMSWPMVARLLSCDRDDRVATLTAHRYDILDDADRVLGEVVWHELGYFADCARDVVSAMKDGHDRPAQSFAASILTGLLQGTLQYRTLKEARDAFSEDWKEESIFLLRFALITSTIPTALSQFVPHNGDPVPTAFNRHALSHFPDPAQLTEANALVGLMVIVALLRELQALHDNGQLS